MRIAVIGTSGAGKTTFSRRLAGVLGAPHIELDAINWGANWRDLNSHEPETFRSRVWTLSLPTSGCATATMPWSEILS